MTREEIEAIAREVYTKDPFPRTDEVWCNLHWLSKFALAVEVHANSELIKDYAEWMPPEDYTQLSRRVDDLSALVRLLVHNIRKFNIDNVPATRAMDYLKRHRFSGNILRSDEPQPKEIHDSGGHIESADCWCGPTVEEHPGGRLVIHNRTH